MTTALFNRRMRKTARPVVWEPWRVKSRQGHPIHLLQQNVDEEIQRTGFVPDEGYGISEQGARNGHRNGTNGHSAPTNGNSSNGHAANGDAWACSEKQQDLIIKLVDEHQLDKGQVDDTSREMFGVGVRELNKLQASGLIERLIEDNGGNRRNGSSRSHTTPRREFANGGVR